jgi:hypothetical protein
MTPEQMATIGAFAGALGKLKAKQELGQGAQLTADEVNGIIWGIKQLRGGAQHGPADNPAER